MSPEEDARDLASWNLPAPGTAPMASTAWPTRQLGAIRRLTIRFMPEASSRTRGMHLPDLDWATAPYSPSRYVATSRVVHIQGYSVEIIREPFEALAPILTLAYIDLNRLLYAGNRARPGAFMHLHLASASTLAVARRDDHVVGFSLATHLVLDGHHVVLHNATAVDPAVRGQALTFLLNAVHVFDAFGQTRGRPFYSAARTYNPLVYGTMLSSGPYYPRPEAPVPPDMRHVASLIAHFLDPAAIFDPDVMVQRSAWKNLHEGAIPRHRKVEINAFCDRHLRYDRGDGLIVVGRFSLGALCRVACRSAWKQLAPSRRR